MIAGTALIIAISVYLSDKIVKNYKDGDTCALALVGKITIFGKWKGNGESGHCISNEEYDNKK